MNTYRFYSGTACYTVLGFFGAQVWIADDGIIAIVSGEPCPTPAVACYVAPLNGGAA